MYFRRLINKIVLFQRYVLRLQMILKNNVKYIKDYQENKVILC